MTLTAIYNELQMLKNAVLKENPVTADEAAKALGISVGAFYNNVSAGKYDGCYTYDRNNKKRYYLSKLLDITK